MKILLLGKDRYGDNALFKALKGRTVTDFVEGKTRLEVFACGNLFEILDRRGSEVVDKKDFEECKAVIIMHVENKVEALEELLSKVGSLDVALVRVDPDDEYYKTFDLEEEYSCFTFDSQSINLNVEEIFLDFTAHIDVNGEEIHELLSHINYNISKIKKLQKEINKAVEALEMKTKDMY